MDRHEAHRRLRDAGLDEDRVAAVTRLLWNVHETGRIDDLDLAHLSDAGFRHAEVCVMRELLAVALSRRGSAEEPASGPASVLLDAFRGGGG